MLFYSIIYNNVKSDYWLIIGGKIWTIKKNIIYGLTQKM